MRSVVRLLRKFSDAVIRAVSSIAAALVSNRGLAVLALAGCVLLITGPWLRPPLSRDFRGLHIPIGELTSVSFVPELTAAPRPLRWDSIAMPLLAVVGAGIVLVVIRPRWTGRVFGLLLALSIPALAISLWNYPALIESFESDMRDRALLRSVFRQHSEHMLSAGTPNRLAVLGNKSTRKDLLIDRAHPLLLPLDYSVYGGWLIGFTLVATIASERGTWRRRFGYASVWGAAGVLLALAATWPRMVSEYHFARAESFENADRFDEAEDALGAAGQALPSMENTWRYWLAKGRLSFRQQRVENKFATFYLAHQAVLNGDLTRARALAEPEIRAGHAATVQCDLFAAICGQTAAEYVSYAKYSAAESCWDEAMAVAPWKLAYPLAHAAARAAAAPHRARSIAEEASPLLAHIGDRMVVSDFHSLMADAHFVSGNFDEARRMYDLAMDIFHLPKYINVPAQEGRLGM
jgi:tetratricopeptide (TPR) repeat protein